jgi:hypothetical protein
VELGKFSESQGAANLSIGGICNPLVTATVGLCRLCQRSSRWQWLQNGYSWCFNQQPLLTAAAIQPEVQPEVTVQPHLVVTAATNGHPRS